MRFAVLGLLLVTLGACHRAQVDLAELIDPATAGGRAARPAVTEPLAPDGLPWLGSTCSSDAQCNGQGLHCLVPSEDYRQGAGAPPQGLCTADCFSDEDCRIFEPGAVCADLAEAPLGGPHGALNVPRICLQGCSLGAPPGEVKCHGRSELACRAFAPPGAPSCSPTLACPDGMFCFRDVCRESACGPRCNSNADCHRGRYCNPTSGLCDASAPRQPVLGANCYPDASACGAGTCLKVLAADGEVLKHMCTQSCTIGSLCANGSGACITARLEHYAVGDAGYCQQLCECDADCQHPADLCRVWSPAGLAENFGSRGFCEAAAADEIGLSCDDASP